MRLALIAVAIAVTYGNSLSGPFLFDDHGSIVQNERIRDLRNARAVLSPPSNTPVAGRPLVNLSFAINYAAGQLNPRGYHVVNIAIHLVCALLIFGIVRRTVRHEGAADVAFATALLWGLHPLNSETVNYVTQRTESMMAAFYLLTLYAAIRAVRGRGRVPWTWMSIGACLAGMACKETMVTAPLMVVLYDRVFVYESVRDAFKARGRLYAGLASTWVLPAVLVAGHGQTLAAGFGTAGTSPWNYLLNQAVMIVRYLYLAVWPGPLVVYYGWPQPLTLAGVWPQGLLVLLLLGLTIVLLRRKPPIGFLGAWFFLILAPTSSVLPIATEVGAERRMYLPLAAVIVLAVAASIFLVRRWRPRLALSPQTATMVAILAAVPLAVSTAARNLEYSSPLTLARTVLDRWPSAQAHHLVGTELAAAGRSDTAVVHLREAARGYSAARFPLGSELLKMGQTAEGIGELQRFLREEPNVLAARSAHGLLADAFAARREFDAAIPHYREYLAAFPNDGHAWTGLGIALISSGQAANAVAAFRNALKADPANTRFQINLARALLDSGNLSEAAAAARQAASAQPADPAPHDILARAAAAQGDAVSARNHFQRAIQLDPTYAPALDGLRALEERARIPDP